jgi:hypothetical protein
MQIPPPQPPSDPLNPAPSAPPIPEANVAYNPAQGDTTGGLIPYKNRDALLSYYIGLFSALPVLGLPMGIAAVILGRKGLRAFRANPIIKGKAHAWIGIICGAFWAVFYAVLLGLFLMALASRPRG